MRNHKIHLQYTAKCLCNNKIWFLNGRFNCLFSLDLNDFSLEYKQKLSFFEGRSMWAYGDVCCAYNNNLFFFPAGCRQIVVYNIETDNIQEVSITPMDDSEIYITHGIMQMKEQIWIFPGELRQGIFVLDSRTLQLKKDLELCKTLKEIEYIYKLVKLNGTTVAILSEGNMITEIDMQKKQKIYSKHFTDDINIWSMNYDGSSFWLLQCGSTDVYEWNQAGDKLVKYQLVEEVKITIEGVPYKDILFVNNQVFLLGSGLKYILKVDKEMRAISKIAVDYPKGFRILNNTVDCMKLPTFGTYDVIGDKVLLHPLISNMLLLYDIEKNIMEGKELVITSEEYPSFEKVIEQGFTVNGIFYEVEEFGCLEDFLNIMVEKKYLCNYMGETKRIGEKIYSSII